MKWVILRSLIILLSKPTKIAAVCSWSSCQRGRQVRPKISNKQTKLPMNSNVTFVQVWKHARILEVRLIVFMVYNEGTQTCFSAAFDFSTSKHTEYSVLKRAPVPTFHFAAGCGHRLSCETGQQEGYHQGKTCTSISVFYCCVPTSSGSCSSAEAD